MPWYVIIEGALIIELSPSVDLWFCLDEFRWLPSLKTKNTKGQEDIDFQWLWFWAGYTRRKKDYEPRRQDEEADSASENGGSE